MNPQAGDAVARTSKSAVSRISQSADATHGEPAAGWETPPALPTAPDRFCNQRSFLFDDLCDVSAVVAALTNQSPSAAANRRENESPPSSIIAGNVRAPVL